jgi:hypothetical protein
MTCELLSGGVGFKFASTQLAAYHFTELTQTPPPNAALVGEREMETSRRSSRRETAAGSRARSLADGNVRQP